MAILSAVPAYAQSAGASGESEDIIVTATRAVTATKTDTPIIEIPQSITVVTTADIRERGGLTILDALNYTAGVSNAGEDTRGDFNRIRGFDSVLFLDGLKRNFGFVYTPRPDINTLDRVEVLLGPSAVLYGAGSSGGLINLQSKRPRFELGGEASVSYGTYSRKQGVFDITGPLSETIAARFVAVVRDANMLIKQTPDNRVVFQTSLTWQPSDRTSLTFIGLYQRDFTGPVQYAPVIASLLAPPGRRISPRTLLGEPTFNRGPKKDWQGTILFNQKFSDTFSFHSSSRLQRARTSYGEIYGDFFGNPLDPFLDEDDEVVSRNLFAINARYRSFNTENHIEASFETGPLTHKVLAGVDYSYFRQLSEQAFAFGGAPPINIYNPVYGAPINAVFGPTDRQMLKQVGFYAQNQIRYEDFASLVVGVRRDRVRTENSTLPTTIDKATTWRVGLTVNVTPKLAPFASFAQSFLPFAGLNQFGRPFIPLTGEQYEAGVKWQPFSDTLLRASVYRIKEANYLRPDPENPLTSIQSGSVKAKGFELQADHKVPGDINVTASYAYNSTRASGENRQQDATPKHTARLFATKTVTVNDALSIRAGAGVRYVGKQANGAAGSPPPYPQIIVPSYTLVDAVVAADYGNWTLQLNAINVLDKFYYASCNAFGGCGGNGDQRTINATLSYRF